MLRKNDDAFTKDHKAFRVDEYRDLLGSSGLQVDEVRTVDALGPLLATAFDYLKVGRLGLAPRIAGNLAALDDFICGADGRTAAGLMLAGRAVKASCRSTPRGLPLPRDAPYTPPVLSTRMAGILTKIQDFIFRSASLREARSQALGPDQNRARCLQQSRLIVEVARRTARPAEALPGARGPPS